MTTRVEVTIPHGAPQRGGGGRFSSIQHAFDTAAKDVLKKYALLDDKGNQADFLAKLFSRSNFGYGVPQEEPRKGGGEPETNARLGLVGPRNGDMDVEDAAQMRGFAMMPIV